MHNKLYLRRTARGSCSRVALGLAIASFSAFGVVAAQAQTAGHVYVNQAPQFTTNAGIIYDRNGIYASVIDEWTGGEYSGNGTVSPAVGKSPGGWYDPYNVINVSAGYTFEHALPHINHLSLKLNIDNITNQNQFIFDNGDDASGNPLYFKLTSVSAFFTASVPITF